MELQRAATQFINEFSSGMKQRVKLAQAFFSDTPILLLDEPCSNLDQKGVNLYQQWLQELAGNRLVIIASNDEREYTGAISTLDIQAFK
jgi:ABC-type multidrug transport system ATPase subunit